MKKNSQIKLNLNKFHLTLFREVFLANIGDFIPLFFFLFQSVYLEISYNDFFLLITHHLNKQYIVFFKHSYLILFVPLKLIC